jgi:hypothetical protein
LEDFIGNKESTNWPEPFFSWHIKVVGILVGWSKFNWQPCWTPFPNSTLVADDAVLALYVDSAERYLQEYSYPQHPQLELELYKHALSAFGAANDPYVHCMLSIFHLSFYHGADVNVSHMANLNYRIATRVWPALSQESKFLHKQRRPNKVKKIKLGIASGILSPGSSVTSDFSGV